MTRFSIISLAILATITAVFVGALHHKQGSVVTGEVVALGEPLVDEHGEIAYPTTVELADGTTATVAATDAELRAGGRETLTLTSDLRRPAPDQSGAVAVMAVVSVIAVGGLGAVFWVIDAPVRRARRSHWASQDRGPAPHGATL